MRGTRARVAALCIATLTSIAAFAGCGGTRAGGDSAGSLEDMEPIVLKVADPASPEGLIVSSARAYFEKVKELSGGKIDYEIYAAGSLVPGTEGLDAVESGTADVAFLNPAYFGDQLPTALWAADLGTIPSRDSYPTNGFATTLAYQTTIDGWDAFEDEFAEHNAVPLVASLATSPYSLLCSKPVESLDDAKGLRVRSPGATWTAELKALGMVNVYVETSEAYEAMQRGIIDCYVGVLSTLQSQGLMEVAKYWVPLPVTLAAGNGYMINQQVWDSLPEEGRQIMLDARSTLITEFLKRANKANVAFVDALDKMDVETMDVTALLPTLLEAQDQAIEGLPSRAPESVDDASERIEQFKSEYEEFAAVMQDEFGVAPNDGSTDATIDAFRETESFPYDESEAKVKDYLGEGD